jgi:polygalacturonase
MLVENCLMESGHGAVTVGSEIAGGVRNMTVRNCFFHNTDRGLRIKTRRGRGRDSVLDDITFENISMDHVLTPFAVNSFYFCDPDGKTDYVQSRNKYPVDDRTPEIGCLTFRNIDAVNTGYAAGYYLGLPEKPIREIRMENVRISYKEDAGAGKPVMSENVPDCCKAGIYAENVQKLVLENVEIDGCRGEKVIRMGAGAKDQKGTGISDRNSYTTGGRNDTAWTSVP